MITKVMPNRFSNGDNHFILLAPNHLIISFIFAVFSTNYCQCDLNQALQEKK
jgi:hypothetical protein